MDIDIRHVQQQDVEAVHEIMLNAHVIRGSMRLPYQSLDHTRARLEKAEGVFKLVAQSDGKIVGYCELITYPNLPRHRHAGEINMIVTHEKWQGKGVGRALMTAMIELADNWLRLSRLSLIVWTTNAPAIHLYEKLGFSIEGTMVEYAFGEGQFVDAYMMGRVTHTN